MADDKSDGVKVTVINSENKPIRVLLLDDLVENLLLRATILRQKGYEVVTSESVAEAEKHLDEIDIAVLDYHLGAGKFGTQVAEVLRKKRPQVPIIILSATLERRFGGIADMHLLKGHSSVDDLVNALRNFEAKRRGKPVVIDAQEFYYQRISMSMGEDIALEIMDCKGTWQYVNDYFAALLGKKRHYFVGRNLFGDFPQMTEDWREIIETVASTRETYIDRGFLGVPHLPAKSRHWTWNVLVFPLKLHDDRDGVMLSARLIEKKGFR